MRSAPRAVAISAFLMIASTAPASAQSVADVVEGMYAAIEQYSSGVDDYTLVQSVMGFETVTYFVKEVVNGRTTFRPQQTSVAGMGGSQSVAYADMAELGPGLVEHGRYVGREDIEGRSAHVIEIADLSALDLEAPSGPEDMDFVAKSGRIYVDAELSVPRRMVFEGEATTDTGTHDVTSVVDMLDYREVSGLLVPYRSVISIEGIEAMMDPEMRERLAEMESQLEDLDPQQRAMMERMLGPQMEQIREMAGGGGGPMTMEITVTDVRVNAGPPRG